MNKKELKIFVGEYEKKSFSYLFESRQLLAYYYAIEHPDHKHELSFYDVPKDFLLLMELPKDKDYNHAKLIEEIKMPSEAINLDNYREYFPYLQDKKGDKISPAYLINLSKYCFNLSKLYKYVSNNMTFFTMDVLLDLDSLDSLTLKKIYRVMGFFEAKYREQLKNLKGAHAVKNNSQRNIQKLLELLSKEEGDRIQDKKYRRKFINKVALDLEVTGRTVENWLKKIESEPVE